MGDLSATLLPNAGSGSGTFRLHWADGRGVMLQGGEGRNVFTSETVWRQVPPPCFRTAFPGVWPRTQLFRAGVFHGNRTRGVTTLALQRGPPGSSEIIPLRVGQDPRGLKAKQNPDPCPADTPHGGPVCWGTRETGDLSR